MPRPVGWVADSLVVVIVVVYVGIARWLILDKLAKTLGGWVDDFPAQFLKPLGLAELLGTIGLIVPPLVHVAPILAPVAERRRRRICSPPFSAFGTPAVASRSCQRERVDLGVGSVEWVSTPVKQQALERSGGCDCGHPPRHW